MVQVHSKAPLSHTTPMTKSKTQKDDAATLPIITTIPTQAEQDQAKAWLEFVRSLSPYEALVKAISECENVTASRINPHFKSRYFGLADLLAEIKPVLGRYGLAAFQVPCSNADRVWISTSIVHISGHIFNCGELGVNAAGLNQQNIGSVFTYLKRYALSTVVGVASELEDDDGHQASKPLPTQTITAKVTPSPYQQPKPQASASQTYHRADDTRREVSFDWLTTEKQIIVATDILVNKGWLSQGQALADLSAEHLAELSNPKMKLAFMEAVKSRLS